MTSLQVLNMFDKAEAEYETLNQKKRIVNNDKAKIQKVGLSSPSLKISEYGSHVQMHLAGIIVIGAAFYSYMQQLDPAISLSFYGTIFSFTFIRGRAVMATSKQASMCLVGRLSTMSCPIVEGALGCKDCMCRIFEEIRPALECFENCRFTCNARVMSDHVMSKSKADST